MFALWLTVLMPTLSRVLPASPMDAGCAGQVIGHAHAMNDGDHGGAPMHGLDKCGYCSLFTHSPLTAGGVAIAVYGPLLPPAQPRIDTVEKTLRTRLLSARPRGPPAAVIG